MRMSTAMSERIVGEDITSMDVNTVGLFVSVCSVHTLSFLVSRECGCRTFHFRCSKCESVDETNKCKGNSDDEKVREIEIEMYTRAYGSVKYLRAKDLEKLKRKRIIYVTNSYQFVYYVKMCL